MKLVNSLLLLETLSRIAIASYLGQVKLTGRKKFLLFGSNPDITQLLVSYLWKAMARQKLLTDRG